METDVCLDRPGRAIILDTKFYAQALKAGAFGATAKLPSANLYQLFTYLRQRATEPGWEQAEGVLLYPRTTRDFAVEFTTHGHRIRARTLDLSQPWRNIHAGLMHPTLIALLGLCLGELWDLEALAEDCARTGVYECFLSCKPLNVTGGVGSPANAMAIV